MNSFAEEESFSGDVKTDDRNVSADLYIWGYFSDRTIFFR